MLVNKEKNNNNSTECVTGQECKHTTQYNIIYYFINEDVSDPHTSKG